MNTRRLVASVTLLALPAIPLAADDLRAMTVPGGSEALVTAPQAGGEMPDGEPTESIRLPDTVGPETGYEPFAALRVDDILGRKVVGADGNVVGEADYIIRQNSDLAAVIGVGGFLGLGEYTVAIPLNQFEVTEDDTLLLDILDEESLRRMPEIDTSGLEPLDGDVVLGEAH